MTKIESAIPMTDDKTQVPTFVNFCKNKKNSEIVHGLGFYSEEFSPQLILVYFKGWSIDDNEPELILLNKKYNVELRIMPNSLKFKNSTGTIVCIDPPKTISDFISDCDRIFPQNIVLEFTKKSMEMLYGYRSISRIDMSDIELNDRLRWCALFDGYKSVKDSVEEEEHLFKHGKRFIQPYKGCFRYHDDYNYLMALRDKIEKIELWDGEKYNHYRVDMINRGMVEVLENGEKCIAAAGLSEAVPPLLSLFLAVSDFCKWYVCKNEKK